MTNITTQKYLIQDFPKSAQRQSQIPSVMIHRWKLSYSILLTRHSQKTVWKCFTFRIAIK